VVEPTATRGHGAPRSATAKWGKKWGRGTPEGRKFKATLRFAPGAALDDTEITWNAALAYCEGLTVAAKSDWRLPSIKELATLVNEAATSSPAIDQSVFGASAAKRYWSSSPAFTATAPGYANGLQIDLGVAGQWQMTDVASARCVRQAN
jgi:formylglycine-generating enzyme required for sulfatase activity